MKKNVPADIVIYVKGKGITLREKSLMAISGNKIIAYGNECERIQDTFTTEEESFTVLSPFKQGKIDDFTCAIEMLKHFVNEARGRKKTFFKPVIGVVVPDDITMSDQRAFEDALFMLGAKECCWILHDSLESVLNDLSPELKKKFDILIGIEKENPLEYIQETISELLIYAKKKNISEDSITDLFLCQSHTVTKK